MRQHVAAVLQELSCDAASPVDGWSEEKMGAAVVDVMEDENPSKSLVSRVVACRDATEVSKVVDSVTQEASAFREMLDACFTELIKRGKHGLRGVMIMICVYESAALAASRWPSNLVESVLDHVLWLAEPRNAHALLRLRNWKTLEGHGTIVERLAACRIFRVMIQAKFLEGPSVIFWIEVCLYVVLALCYTVLALARKRRVPFASGRLGAAWALVALPALDYFSVKIDTTLRFLAEFERGLDGKKKASAASRAAGCAWHSIFCVWQLVTWVWHRATALVALPVYGPIAYWLVSATATDPVAFRQVALRDLRRFLLEPPQLFFSASLAAPRLPRAWYSDPLNFIELGFLASAWIVVTAALFTEADELRSRAIDSIVDVGTLLMWLRFLSFVRGCESAAAFVILLTRKLCSDLFAFLVVLLIVFAGFVHSLYLKISFRGAADSGFTNIIDTMYFLYLFSFTGEVDGDEVSRDSDRVFLVLLLFVMVVVMLNVLIAIVSEAYEDAMSRGTHLFWRSRFELVAETHAFWGPKAILANVDRQTLAAILHHHLPDDLVEDTAGASHRLQLARIISIVRTVQHDQFRVESDLDANVKRLETRLLAIHESLDKLAAQLRPPPSNVAGPLDPAAS